MENFDDLFGENGFLPCIGEAEPVHSEPVIPQIQHKSLEVLLAEKEAIDNYIEEIKAKEWRLAEMLKFHNAGLSRE